MIKFGLFTKYANKLMEDAERLRGKGTTKFGTDDDTEESHLNKLIR